MQGHETQKRRCMAVELFGRRRERVGGHDDGLLGIHQTARWEATDIQVLSDDMPLDAAECRWMPHRHGQNRPRRCMVGAMNLVERRPRRTALAHPRGHLQSEGPSRPPRRPVPRPTATCCTTAPVFAPSRFADAASRGFPLRQLRDGVENGAQLPIISRPIPTVIAASSSAPTVGDMVVGRGVLAEIRGLDGTVKASWCCPPRW